LKEIEQKCSPIMIKLYSDENYAEKKPGGFSGDATSE